MTIDDDWDAEDLFPEARKQRRAERKQASARDRSKYKITDQRKLRVNDELHPNIKGCKEDYRRGRVLEQTARGWQVESEDELFTCVLRGILKKERSLLKNLVTVGDFVFFEPLPDQEGSIVHVEARKSTLSRADNLSRRKEQLIAANIDQVFITTSVMTPPLKPALIDRYIIAARKGGMEPIIVVNKIDLLEAPEEEEEDPSYRLFQIELLEEVEMAYRKIGLTVLTCSADMEDGLEGIKVAMTGKASVFSGQSGVGKTSLINQLTGTDLRVGDVVEKTRKGAHTTTSPKLLRLDFNGWCIDTPGIKSFGIWDLSRDEIEAHFPEILEAGRSCRYLNCTHHHEPECAVHLAIDADEISVMRFESYLSLIEGITKKHLRR